jgi:tetratricopeptide (TPR) repeat protein
MIPRLHPILLALSLVAPVAASDADDPKTLMDDGHYRRAQSLLDAAAASHPDDARTLYLQSRLKLMTGDADAALPLAERAVAAAPRDPDYRYQVAACVGSQAQHAGKFKALGLAKRFKREAEAVLAIDSHHVDAIDGLISFYSQAPGIAGGDDKRAAALAESLARIDPARGRLAQADLYFRDKHVDQGEQALRQALAAVPGDYQVRMTLARFLANDTRKQWQEAETHLRAALAIKPGRIGPYAGLAGLYAHLGRWDDLDKILAEAERAVPDNRSPSYQAARILLGDDKEPARAERLFRAYLASEPEIGAPTLAHAHWRLGLVIEKQGRKPEALAEVQQALALKPDLGDDAKKDLKRLKKG